MILAVTTVTLALTAPSPVQSTTLPGVNGWQGIHAITIPGRHSRSVQLMQPIRLDLTLGGFARSEIADGMVHLQQHDGRVHGVLKSRRYGAWTLRGDASTGRLQWTPLEVTDAKGCTEIIAPFDNGDGEHGGEPAAGPPLAHDGAGDTGRVIDILVSYTSLAVSNAGSDGDMQAAINYWVNDTNDILKESRVPTRLRLVGTHHVNYSDAGVGFEAHIDRLTNRSDGFMDDVHPARDAVGADLVALIVGDATDACGIGWLLQNQGGSHRHAFCVVADVCADSTHTLAHEIGHNLGCCHNSENAGSCQPSNRLGSPFGHRFNGDFGQWRTVMSYNDGFGSFARAPRFSNPDVLWDGAPTGTGQADNATVIAVTRSDASAYRSAVTTMTCLGDFDADDRIAVTDLLEMLEHWGSTSGGSTQAKRPDLNGDAFVDVADLIVLLHEFGACPA